ncbi:hypothetical protein ZIOFF_040171 [Zingiber officinale]|uniref:NIF system FeS cluster assembly NifU N-terminal domain-containing protein n=1 Tax=Zingiber officinale TaxID=94328 RepID=A0A8J5G3G4_ZINOF|nr:hypothetical protein ZIOFF_040171 [Zingiber officinale]
MGDLMQYEPNTIDLTDPGELEQLQVKGGQMMLKEEEMHLLMHSLLTWQGNTVISSRDILKFTDFTQELASLGSELGTQESLPVTPFNCDAILLMEEPAAYGKFGLANLLELREECLREFQFMDAYITIKQSDIAKHLSLPPVKLHCSMLAEDAIKAAVKDYEAKKVKSTGKTEAVQTDKVANA